jgi:hypothetical protein
MRNTANGQTVVARAERDKGSGSGRFGGAESQMDDQERLRMVAFRINETANRIGTLAQRAQNPALRHDLLAIRERLLNEGRELLARHG